MNDLELIDLWRELKNGGQTLPAGSPLITNCEKELAELMRQIDIMFRSKRVDWSKEKAVLHMKLESREKECALQQESIDQKNKEIGQLREQLIQLERGDKSLVTDYQKQVEQLHKDLTMLKKQYEKMRNRHNKEKLRMSAELDSSLIELNNTTRKLKKLESESESWMKDKKLMQQEIDKLSMQMKSLVEKCSLLEHQGGNYQDQLERRKQLLGDIEVNLRSEQQHLRKELHETEDREAEKSVQIARLKADLTHWKNKTSKLQKDLQSSENALRKANSEVYNLRTQVESMTRELKTQGGALNLATVDQTGQEKELMKLRDMLKERDITIQTLLERNHLDESAALESLKADLLKADEHNRALKSHETELRGEVARLSNEFSQISSLMKSKDEECLKLREKLHSNEKTLREREVSDIKIRDNELNDLQSRMHRLRDSHSVEVASLQNELDSVRRQLCEAIRSRPPVVLSTSVFTEDTSRATSPTNTVTSETPAAQFTMAELRMTQKQLDAVRLENKHLREQVLAVSDSSTARLNNDDQREQNRDMRKLEKDNERLHQDVNRMREELEKVQNSHHRKYQAILREMQQDILIREQRLKEEQQAELERYKWTNDSQQELKESGYRSALNALSAEKEILKERLNQTVEELEHSWTDRQALVDENAAMASFAGHMTDLCATSSQKDQTLFGHDQTSEYLRVSPDPVRRLTYQHPTPRATSPAHSTSTKKSYRSAGSQHSSRHSSRSPRDSHHSSKRHSRRSLDESSRCSSRKSSSGDKSSPKSAVEKRRSRRLSDRSSHSPSSYHGGKATSHDKSYEYATSSGRSLADASLLDFETSVISSKTAGSAAEAFLGDQKRRATALEQMLDRHLQELRLDGHQTLNSTTDYLKSFS